MEWGGSSGLDLGFCVFSVGTNACSGPPTIVCLVKPYMWASGMSHTIRSPYNRDLERLPK